MTSEFAIVTTFAVFREGEVCFHTNHLPETPVTSYVADGDWVHVHFAGGDTVNIPTAQVRFITANA
ncbi:hypothetical protein ACOKM3_14135 [Streptomyces sp. BH106]|uniref:hypothetical protein n=1 Tax=Streptomyces sp. BH106 TaxID=3410409 RepID=UPI003CF42ECC